MLYERTSNAARQRFALLVAGEQTGLGMAAVKFLGERVHPKAGRLMSYTACEAVSGTTRVVDAEELDAPAWVAHAEIPGCVPYGLFEPVQAYLDSAPPG
ncbi:NUDIX hydrolase [Kitasatospora sp. NPDC088351]|uniref:NUDIX hydrolase n=1 Tax=Kitasatospora sp. NPDC088351 TaxID=3155180 RepID=UPI00342606E3